MSGEGFFNAADFEPRAPVFIRCENGHLVNLARVIGVNRRDDADTLITDDRSAHTISSYKVNKIPDSWIIDLDAESEAERKARENPCGARIVPFGGE